jgi:hypothetical protein
MLSQISNAVVRASSGDRSAYRKYDAGSADAVLRRRRKRSTYDDRMWEVAAST